MSDIVGLPGSGTGDSVWNVPPLPSSGVSGTIGGGIGSGSSLLSGLDLGSGSDDWSEGSTGNSFLDTLEGMASSASGSGPLLPSANTDAPAATAPNGSSSTSGAATGSGSSGLSGFLAKITGNMYNIFAVVLGIVFVIIGASSMARAAGTSVPVVE
jgi:hypothetical protein